MKQEALLLLDQEVKDGTTPLSGILHHASKHVKSALRIAQKIEVRGAQKIERTVPQEELPLFYTKPIFFAKENDPL
jgi:hypothetical protein